MRSSELIYICCFLYQKVKVGLSKFIHICCLLWYRKMKFRENIVWCDFVALLQKKWKWNYTFSESMSKSNLLPSFSESGSEIKCKFVQLNQYTVCTLHFLCQTFKFSPIHFLRVYPSTFFLISESESRSTLGPTWSVFVIFLPKKMRVEVHVFCLPPCLICSTAVPLRKWEWRLPNTSPNLVSRPTRFFRSG